MFDCETYKGFEFCVFLHTKDCGDDKAGEWNGNLYQPGLLEPIGYGFEPQTSEVAIRAHIEAIIDGFTLAA